MTICLSRMCDAFVFVFLHCQNASGLMPSVPSTMLPSRLVCSGWCQTDGSPNYGWGLIFPILTDSWLPQKTTVFRKISIEDVDFAFVTRAMWLSLGSVETGSCFKSALCVCGWRGRGNSWNVLYVKYTSVNGHCSTFVCRMNLRQESLRSFLSAASAVDCPRTLSFVAQWCGRVYNFGRGDVR
jgi:hypothetical protein